MAKPHADEWRETGEQRLREWGVAGDAGPSDLAALLHRDPAADAAIAHRLGAIPSDESARVLQRMECEAADKRVRREAKRALYRLEQRGVRIPEPLAAPPGAPVVVPAMEGYLSSVDGRGDQLVWLVKPQPGGLAHLFAVINDPEGIREVSFSLVTRKAIKSVREALQRKHDLRLVEVDWRYADFLMHRAFTWARARDARGTGDYPGLRAQLTHQPAPEDLAPPVLARVDLAAIDADESLLANSATLLEQPEFRTWFLTAEQLKPYLEELAGVKESPLVLNKMQQEERFQAVITRAIVEVFGGDRRAAWARRLYEMAYFFSATARRANAEQAVAAARALGGPRPPHDIPFCATVVRASLAFFFQMAMEEESEREKTSLVLTPQQVRAQRERR